MMGSNSVVSELKENFRLSQPTPRLFFGGILFLVVEATNSLLTILFSFASLSRIENISIISRRDKKHNRLWREPPAMINNNKARGKAEKAKYQY